MNFADYCTNELEFRICTNCKDINTKLTNRLKNVNVSVYYQRLLTFVIFHNKTRLLTFIIIFGRLTHLYRKIYSSASVQ